jgi:hypothetical protein
MAKSAAPLLLGAGAIALFAMGNKKSSPNKGGRIRHGVFVSHDCKTIRVANYDRFRDYIRGGFNELHEGRPELDWFDISHRLFDDAAPDCTGFPGTPASADTVMLWTTILRMVGYLLAEEKLSNLIDIISDDRMAKLAEWTQAYGGGVPGDLPADIPENQAGFSPDFSKSWIGPSWRSQTLMPFLESEKGEGRTGDAAYDRFVNNHNVAVGTYHLPIIELPGNEPKVQKLLERISTAVQEIASA